MLFSVLEEPEGRKRLDALRAAGKRVKRTHALEDAFMVAARMQPLCTLITVARNFYTRSPSHFFHNLVVDPAKHFVAVQQYGSAELAAELNLHHPQRWPTRASFLQTPLADVAAEFHRVNPKPATHAMLTVLKAGETVYQTGILPEAL